MQVQPTHVFDKLLEYHDQANYQRFGFAKYVLKNCQDLAIFVKSSKLLQYGHLGQKNKRYIIKIK